MVIYSSKQYGASSSRCNQGVAHNSLGPDHDNSPKGPDWLQAAAPEVF